MWVCWWHCAVVRGNENSNKEICISFHHQQKWHRWPTTDETEANGSIMDIKLPVNFLLMPFTFNEQRLYQTLPVKLNLQVKLQCNVKEGIIWSDKTGQKMTLQCVGELRSGINGAFFCKARSLHCRDQDTPQFEICDCEQDLVDTCWLLDTC